MLKEDKKTWFPWQNYLQKKALTIENHSSNELPNRHKPPWSMCTYVYGNLLLCLLFYIYQMLEAAYPAAITYSCGLGLSAPFLWGFTQCYKFLFPLLPQGSEIFFRRLDSWWGYHVVVAFLISLTEELQSVIRWLSQQGSSISDLFQSEWFFYHCLPHCFWPTKTSWRYRGLLSLLRRQAKVKTTRERFIHLYHTACYLRAIFPTFA